MSLSPLKYVLLWKLRGCIRKMRVIFIQGVYFLKKAIWHPVCLDPPDIHLCGVIKVTEKDTGTLKCIVDVFLGDLWPDLPTFGAQKAKAIVVVLVVLFRFILFPFKNIWHAAIFHLLWLSWWLLLCSVGSMEELLFLTLLLLSLMKMIGQFLTINFLSYWNCLIEKRSHKWSR